MIPAAIQPLVDYSLHILPGLILLILSFIILKPGPGLRILFYLAGFILLRDAMTILNLWTLGIQNQMLWIRLKPDAVFLITFGLSSLGIVASFYYFDRANRSMLVWFRNNPLVGLLAGLAGCLLVIAPIAYAQSGIHVELRGGDVSRHLLLAILIFALLGNLLEETLFRGYLPGILKLSPEQPIKTGLITGLLFASCHIFLALTVTNASWALLNFTLWEGIIAGIVGARYGIVPSTLTHGGAIFFICSGLI